jgi:hypothetical protein
MVAVSYLPGGTGTGCDIQYVSPSRQHESVAARFFAPEEQAYIAAGPLAEQPLRFCHVWALKEAFIKLHGLSITDIVSGRIPAFTPGNTVPGLTFFLYELGNDSIGRYVLAAGCSGTPVEEPELRWFSSENCTSEKCAPILRNFP